MTPAGRLHLRWLDLRRQWDAHIDEIRLKEAEIRASRQELDVIEAEMRGIALARAATCEPPSPRAMGCAEDCVHPSHHHQLWLVPRLNDCQNERPRAEDARFEDGA